MASYATVAQYEALYGAYANDDLLATWLERASAKIARRFSDLGIDPDTALLESCAYVTCSMVHRALDSVETDLPVGMTQFSQTAGSYSRSGSFPGGYGEMYLTKQELVELGLSGSNAAFTVPGASS